MTKEFNISNLKKYVNENGSVIKNYKTLCDILEVPYGSGKQKSLLVGKLSYYFSFERDRNKYIINEIYEPPKPILSYGKNKYLYNIEHRLYHMLRDKESIVMSYSLLAERLGFITQNPNSFSSEKLSEICNCKLSTINDFLMHVPKTYKAIIKRSLETLSNANILKIREVFIIYDENNKKISTEYFSDEDLQSIYDFCKKMNDVALILYAKQNGLVPAEMSMSNLYLPEMRKSFYEIRNMIIEKLLNVKKIISLVQITMNYDVHSDTERYLPPIEDLVKDTKSLFHERTLYNKLNRLARYISGHPLDREWGDTSYLYKDRKTYKEYERICDFII